MTIIIAVQCQDGSVVVAADGAATFGKDDGTLTARQPVSKLCLIHEKAIFAHSGAVGLGQRLQAVFDDVVIHKGIEKRYSPAESMQYLRNLFWEKVIKDESDIVNQTKPELVRFAERTLSQQFLVVLPPLKDTKIPCVIHFNWEAFPEMLTTNLPCVSLGSGQMIADPFLSFIRRVLWENKAPTNLADGIFAVAWTIQHVVKTSPAFISDPCQMMIMKLATDSTNTWETEEIPSNNLLEHFGNVSAIEDYIKEYPELFRDKPN
jgi:hypothetical protein